MTSSAFDDIVAGRHSDPFSILGAHENNGDWRVITFQPQADSVTLVDLHGNAVCTMNQVYAGGLYAARLAHAPGAYRLAIQRGERRDVIDDAYRFGSRLGELDEYLMREGTHYELYRLLGAHPACHDDVAGVSFAVWAPNAIAVCVVGDFNDWHDSRHPMRKHPATGVFELFIPGAALHHHYQYRIWGVHGRQAALKSDPFGQWCERPPARASKVYQSRYHWQDDDWMQRRTRTMANGVGLDEPMCIYEVHAGSWQHGEQGQVLDYRSLADRLIPYVTDMGFTHIEFMPLAAHPFDASWGYQPIGLFAADPRYGEPDDLRYLIDRCHQHGIGVIVDWVAAHFPRDEHGLARFDGSCLFEHEDTRRGEHPDWGTLEFNFGRTEVANYLLANAVFWIKEFHVDMLRVDAVASMLYLDYSREEGQWVANPHGGNEDLEAVAFLKHLNETVHAEGGMTVAEESTSWPMVSRPTDMGGLGFTYKWNMGWMNDTLRYMSNDPVHRKFHHDKLTFGLLYAFSENFILPLSHDEVVHGKGSILDRMPGDDWQKFANVRLYYCFQYAHPGKKLMFMGNEFAQGSEWNYQRPLDWHLCDIHWHAGVKRLVKDLNRLYVTTPALYDRDFDAAGFSWLISDNRDDSILAFVRWADDPARPLVAVFNFTPVTRDDVRVGLPQGGEWCERLNTDSAHYCGANSGNAGVVRAETVPWNDQPYSLPLVVPGLAGILLQPIE